VFASVASASTFHLEENLLPGGIHSQPNAFDAPTVHVEGVNRPVPVARLAGARPRNGFHTRIGAAEFDERRHGGLTNLVNPIPMPRSAP
jgi:hypothetical protein